MRYKKINEFFSNTYKLQLYVTQIKNKIVPISILLCATLCMLSTISVENVTQQAKTIVNKNAGVSLTLSNTLDKNMTGELKIKENPNITVGSGYDTQVKIDNANEDTLVNEQSDTSVEFNNTDGINVGLTNESEPLFQFEETDFVEQDTELVSNVPNNEEGCDSANFTYMDYRKVTAKNTVQYKLLNSDLAYTDEETGIRMYDGLYCVAVGSYYALPGDKIDVTMTNGTVFHCIVGDAKSNKHTDETHRYHYKDGSVVEMIIDGEVFKSTKMYPKDLNGTIFNIYKLTD